MEVIKGDTRSLDNGSFWEGSRGKNPKVLN